MDLENQTKESPLEKAKRLKAEKESKDQAKVEAETKKQADAQAKAEKLGALNNSKQDLESKLDEINSKIETSRNEAHETRDTMKEGGLDKDEEFKGEYDTTISEVAGSLNELRNERNQIKAELEQVNSNIENFEVNEVVSEGKEEIKGEAETVKQGNEEAINQVENYSGAEAGDVKVAEEIVAETNQETDKVLENSEKNISDVVGEKSTENKGTPSSVKDIEEFLANPESFGKGLKGYEQLKNFMQQKYAELNSDSPEYEAKRKELVSASNFVQTKKHPFVAEKYPNLSLGEYEKNKSEIVLGATKYNFTEKAKADIEEVKKSQQEYKPYISIPHLHGPNENLDLDKLTPEFIKENPDVKKGILDAINGTGNNEFFSANDAGNKIKTFLDKGLISEQDIIGTIKNKISESASRAQKEDPAGRYEGQYYKNSRNYFLEKIPTDVLKKLITSDKSFSEEVQMAVDANEKDSNRIIDNAKIDDPIWLKNNVGSLLNSTSQTLRYKKIMGSYDYENTSKKYGSLINQSLNNMVNDKYENKIISSVLSDKEIIPKFIETNVLSKDKILNFYNSSAEKEEKLNDSTVNYRLKDVKNLVKLGVLNEEEALDLSKKYIDKLEMSA